MFEKHSRRFKVLRVCRSMKKIHFKSNPEILNIFSQVYSFQEPKETNQHHRCYGMPFGYTLSFVMALLDSCSGLSSLLGISSNKLSSRPVPLHLSSQCKGKKKNPVPNLNCHEIFKMLFALFTLLWLNLVKIRYPELLHYVGSNSLCYITAAGTFLFPHCVERRVRVDVTSTIVWKSMPSFPISIHSIKTPEEQVLRR